MPQKDDLKDNSYCTMLLLLKTLEKNQVGGLMNSFDWKQALKSLKEKSEAVLSKEKENLQNVVDSIKAAGKRLSADTMSKKQMRDALEEEIQDLVWELMGTSVSDFYIRKAIVLDEKYSQEEIDTFFTDRLLNDDNKKITAAFMKSSYRNRRVKFNNAFLNGNSTDNFFIDPFLAFIILDLVTDGIFDGNFVNDVYGADQIQFDMPTPTPDPIDSAQDDEIRNTFVVDSVTSSGTYEDSTHNSNDSSYDSGDSGCSGSND